MYSRAHLSCNDKDCKILTSYVRIDRKWTKIGYFTTCCKKFELADTANEWELQQASRVHRTMKPFKRRPKKSVFDVYLQDLMS